MKIIKGKLHQCPQCSSPFVEEMGRKVMNENYVAFMVRRKLYQPNPYINTNFDDAAFFFCYGTHSVDFSCGQKEMSTDLGSREIPVDALVPGSPQVQPVHRRDQPRVRLLNSPPKYKSKLTTLIAGRCGLTHSVYQGNGEVSTLTTIGVY